MKTMKWIGWSGIGLLLASLMWTTGCGGSDGDDGTTTVVVTNETGGTTTVVVPAEPSGSESPTVTPLTIALVAPQLVSPPNGQIINTFVENTAVDFQWTAVNGATFYILEVDGSQYSVTSTGIEFGMAVGTHSWSVLARDGSREGPPSANSIFTVSPFTASP